MKTRIIEGLQEQAEANLGMSMTFTLFEWLKEAKDELLEDQPTEASPTGTTEIASNVGQLSITDDQGEVCCTSYTKKKLSCTYFHVNICIFHVISGCFNLF